LREHFEEAEEDDEWEMTRDLGVDDDGAFGMLILVENVT
jgi:hypothetical protein